MEGAGSDEFADVMVSEINMLGASVKFVV